MNSKIPSYFLTAATFFIVASVFAKKFTLTLGTLGGSEVFEWGCAVLSSILIAVGLLLALHGLATQPTKRLYFFGMHFWAIVLFCVLVGCQVAAYVVFTKINNQLDQMPSVLPKLIENSRMADTEAKRQKMAQNAYKVYGATIAYRLDNGELSYYEPSAEDIAFQKNFSQTNARNYELKEEIIGGQIKQYPLVISLETGSFICTLLLGFLWLAINKNRLEPSCQA